MKRTAFFSTLLSVFLLCQSLPALALVRMDSESIDLALKYGMQKRGMGYYTLLGPNWQEGPNGTLLNIYTPFMMLASKTFMGDFPKNPKDEDIQAAKKRYFRVIRDFTDEKVPIRIKYSVGLYGDRPDFAKAWSARIEGVGRGRTIRLKPAKEMREVSATQSTEATVNPYEAMNAYYFDFKSVEVLEDYQLILEAPGEEAVVFRIRNEKIY